MNPRELLDDIRETVDSATWSKAVLCVRHQDVAPAGRQDQALTFDVMMGAPTPYRVEVDLEAGDWSCSCRSAEDACVHVAAAVLHPSGVHVGFRFVTTGRSWKLEAVEVRPGASPREMPLTASPPDRLKLDHAEREALSLIEAGLVARRASRLLWALSRCRDVMLDGMAVRVSPRDVPLVLVVEDHPNGIRARLSTRERCHYRLEQPFPLVVTGTPPQLSPVTAPAMPRSLRDLYEAGRVVPYEAIPKFLAEALAELRRYVDVDMRAHRVALLKDSRPYANMTITSAPEGFDVLVTVAYGRPPDAVVVGSRLVLLEGARGVPRRDMKREQRIAKDIERLLGVPPGRRLALRGVEAARFATDTLPRFRGNVSGRRHVARYRTVDRPLEPRWVSSSEGGDPALVFEVPVPGTADPLSSPLVDTTPEARETPLPPDAAPPGQFNAFLTNLFVNGQVDHGQFLSRFRV